MLIGNTVLLLLLFWTSLHGLGRILTHSRQHSLLPWNLDLSRRRFKGQIDITLRHVHLQVRTTAFNSLHDQSISFIASKRNKRFKVALSLFYKLGYYSSILGMVGAILVLSWTVWRLLWQIVIPPTAPGLLRRDNTLSASHELPIIIPIIPGITTPLSHLPIIVCAVFLSQLFHELGHAISAAIENVPLQSVGASLTLILPSASVAFTSSIFGEVAPGSRSLIVSAGPFHNLIFWVILSGIARTNLVHLWWKLGYQDISDAGRIIVNVAPGSTLSEYLYPGMLMTHINDISLHSIGASEDPWIALQNSQTPGPKGWCVDQNMLSKSQSCCFKEASNISPLSCFRAMGENSSVHGCIDPLPLLTMLNGTTRCEKTLPCSPPDICSYPDPQEQLMRLTVIYPINKQSIILWSGPVDEVQNTVTFGTLKPRLPIFPYTLPQLSSWFLKYLTLSTLSLFFFNLLPVHLLDGHHILKIILGEVGESGSNNYDMEASTAIPRRRSIWTARTMHVVSTWLSNLTLGALALSLILTLLSLRQMSIEST